MTFHPQVTQKIEGKSWDNSVFLSTLLICDLVHGLPFLSTRLGRVTLVPQRAMLLRDKSGVGVAALTSNSQSPQLHPLVAPQVLHFMQVPLRTSV